MIGVFLEASEADRTIQSIWDAIPSAGESPGALAAFDPRALLPEGGSHYGYPGSLTTPVCSEIRQFGVLMVEAIAVSQEQVDGVGGDLSDERATGAAPERTDEQAAGLSRFVRLHAPPSPVACLRPTVSGAVHA